MIQYKIGDLMYLILSHTSLLETSNRRFKVIYIGNLDSSIQNN